jgi:hypothetical protein
MFAIRTHQTKRRAAQAAGAVIAVLTALVTVLLCVGATAADAATAGTARPLDPPSDGPWGNFLNVNSGQCVGASGGYAVLESCSADVENEVWDVRSSFTVSGTTWYQYVNGNGDCLGIAGASTAEDARLTVMADCGSRSANPDQYWSLPSLSPGQLVTNYHSPYVMGVKGASKAAGAEILMSSTYRPMGGDCHPDQIWLL